MNRPVLWLCLLGYVLLGSLPFAFFRRGHFNVAWFVTAAPFFAAAGLVVAAHTGLLSPVDLPGRYGAILAHIAVTLMAVAIALTGCTIGVHRTPVSLWHQQNDTPNALVTHGPYTRIRHPFYTAFIVMLSATAAALPHPATLAVLLLGAVQLHRTARREERRLLASRFGGEYAAYMRRTGRFLPRLLPAAHSPDRLDDRHHGAAARRETADTRT